MTTKEIETVRHRMTPEIMGAFVQHEANNGASENMIRRYKGTLRVIYEFLPEDKCITRERLLEWRKNMEENGYSSITILNYVKYINRYLDYVDCSEIRFNKGRAKDITGMTFGYLTAIEPTGAKNRGDIVWLFKCKCGNTVELPATRALVGNTLSCGCLVGAVLKEAKKYYGGTSIVQSMTEQVKSARSISGYTGVSPKRDKWQAHITYKGVRYSLGSYSSIDGAVKARARAKELVIADAQDLLDFYTELEKTFPKRPNRHTQIPKEFPSTKWVVNDAPASAAKRSNNTSGYPGVYYKRNRWAVRICYKRIRYQLGSYDSIDKAIEVRKSAEQLLKEDPGRFIKEYEKYPHHHM